MSHPVRILATSIIVAAAIGHCPKMALSAVSISGDTTIGSQVLIGNTGFGTFRIDDGSVYTNPSFSTSVIGSQINGIGFATVTGLGSQWNFSNSSGLDIGSSGVGRLEILNGGIVTLSQSAQARIGVNSSSQGTVVVQGSGSLLNVGGQLWVGGSQSSGGSAVLKILDNAIVNAATSQSIIWTGGRVELSDGLLRVNQLTQNGVIIGSGEVFAQSTGTLINSGRIEAGPDDLLKINGSSNSIQNQGIIAAEGGEIEFTRTVTNTTSGVFASEITLRDGLVRVGTLLTNSGPQLTNSSVLAATGGLNDFYGRITNTTDGHIAVTNHSVLVFHDDVTADAGVITVFPGSSAVFLEDLTMNTGSTLLADLAGTNQDTGFGDIEVVGNAQLAGSMQATLATGFTPHAGDTFPLLAASSITGSLSLGSMPDLPSGLRWDLDIAGNRMILNVVPGLAGDYNGNDSVDAADYVLWRHTLGQMGPDLAADGDSNGVVDSADYDFWRSRLGNTLGGGAAIVATVPEPATTTVLFAALALVSYRGRKLE